MPIDARRTRPAASAACLAVLSLTGAGLAGLSVPSLAVGAVPEQAATSQPVGGVVAAAKPAKRVTLTTSYGKKPVKTVAGRKYTLKFKGRKGDRVRIAAVLPRADGGKHDPIDRQTLVSPKGRTVVAAPDGFATLKSSGTHRIRFTATTSRTQLLKLARRTTTSARVSVPARQGVQYVVDVHVGAGTRVTTAGVLTGLSTGGTYRRHDGDSFWFDASTMVAVRGQSLLGADLYAHWDGDAQRPVVGETVRVYLEPHQRATVTPRPMAAVSATVSGPAVTVPRTASGGAVVTLDATTLAGSYATVLLDGVGGGMTARGTNGRKTVVGGYNSQIVSVRDRDAVVLIVPPSGAGKSFTAVPTPVHTENLVVGGPSLLVPARAHGLDTLVMLDASAVVATPGNSRTTLTVHEAPDQPWWLVWGDPFAMIPPRGCNGCGEGTMVVWDQGRHSTYDRGYGNPMALTVGTRNVAGHGTFELSMAQESY